MIEDVNVFKVEYSHQSETFAFWDKFVQMVATLRGLLLADTEGTCSWGLHLHSLQRVLPLFTACDRRNYLRGCSRYLDDMRKLPETIPAASKLMAATFVMKHTSRIFKTIWVDKSRTDK
jgi:hypothetical protein